MTGTSRDDLHLILKVMSVMGYYRHRAIEGVGVSPHVTSYVNWISVAFVNAFNSTVIKHKEIK